MLRFLAGPPRSRRLVNACVLICAPFIANTTIRADDKPTIVGSIERLDPALDKLLPQGAKMEVIGEGYAWCEGPVWIHDGNFLLFSDIPNNAIMRWDAKSGSKLFMKPSG